MKIVILLCLTKHLDICFLLDFLFIEESTNLFPQTSSTTVFSNDNDKCFFGATNQHIRTISKGSCATKG